MARSLHWCFHQRSALAASSGEVWYQRFIYCLHCPVKGSSRPSSAIGLRQRATGSTCKSAKGEIVGLIDAVACHEHRKSLLASNAIRLSAFDSSGQATDARIQGIKIPSKVAHLLLLLVRGDSSYGVELTHHAGPGCPHVPEELLSHRVQVE